MGVQGDSVACLQAASLPALTGCNPSTSFSGVIALMRLMALRWPGTGSVGDMRDVGSQPKRDKTEISFGVASDRMRLTYQARAAV